MQKNSEKAETFFRFEEPLVFRGPADIVPCMSAVGGKYELGERLGGGGMADVFHATTRGAEGFARPVAIKRIKRSISTDKNFGQLFVTEARLAAKLHHPNIVQTLDFDRDERGCYYLVMERIYGVDLRELSLSGRVPVSACCFVASEVLRGLDYAHELVDDGHPITIIHRDISPHNVMLGWQGDVKIVDFGIAKAVEGSLISRSGSLKGKVAYMSPEQVHGHSLDGRSDLFAVGVILHELLTGQRLFVGKTEAETLSKVLTQPVPNPSAINDLVPPDLDAIVMKLLERDRAQRFTRARDAMEEILDSSVSAIKGRRDLETLLGERFPDKAPKRTPRLSTSRSPAGSGSFGSGPVSTVGVSTLPAAGATPTVATAVEPADLKETVPDRRLAKPPQKRTFTAEPALRLGTASAAPTDSSTTAPPAKYADSEQLSTSGRAKRTLPAAAAFAALLTAALVGFLVLRGGVASKPEQAGIELVSVKPAEVSAPKLAPAPTVAAPDLPGLVPERPAPAEPAPEPPSAPPSEPPRTHSAPIHRASGDEHHEKAVLTVLVKPWATVVVDGKSYGQTPQTIELRRGKHRVVLENAGIPRRETLTLKLKSGQKKTLDNDWR